MLWIAALTFFVLWKLAIKIDQRLTKGGGQGGKGGKAKAGIHLLPFVCLTGMVWALYYAPLPFGLGSLAELLAGLVGWLLNAVAGLFGLSGGAVAAVAVLALVLLACWDLFIDLKPDAIAQTAMYVLPVLALVASGPIAPWVLDLIQTINGATPRIAATLTS